MNILNDLTAAPFLVFFSQLPAVKNPTENGTAVMFLRTFVCSNNFNNPNLMECMLKEIFLPQWHSVACKKASHYQQMCLLVWTDNLGTIHVICKYLQGQFRQLDFLLTFRTRNMLTKGQGLKKPRYMLRGHTSITLARF